MPIRRNSSSTSPTMRRGTASRTMASTRRTSCRCRRSSKRSMMTRTPRSPPGRHRRMRGRSPIRSASTIRRGRGTMRSTRVLRRTHTWRRAISRAARSTWISRAVRSTSCMTARPTSRVPGAVLPRCCRWMRSMRRASSKGTTCTSMRARRAADTRVRMYGAMRPASLWRRTST